MAAIDSNRTASSHSVRHLIGTIALAFVFTTPGFLLRLLLSMALDVELSRLAASVLNFGLAAIGALVIFPRVLKQPFGDVPLVAYTRRLGFYLPPDAWKHIALGAVLALCTLGGCWSGRSPPGGTCSTGRT